MTEAPPSGSPPTPQDDRGRGLRARTASGTLGAWIGLGLGVLYLINPTMGLLELLPDNLPIVGNLDEAGAAGLVLGALAYLGIDLVGPFRRRGGGPPGESS